MKKYILTLIIFIGGLTQLYAQCPYQPYVFPANNTGNLSIMPYVEWGGSGDCVNYYIVGIDDGFHTYWGIISASGGSAIIPYENHLSPSTSYFLICTAFDTAHGLSASRMNHISTGPISTAIIPLSNATEIRLNAVFKWTPAVIPSGLEKILISSNINFTDTIYNNSSVYEFLILTEGILQDSTTYYWQVIDNVQGNQLPSYRNSFTTIRNPPGQPGIGIPSNGQTVSLTPLIEFDYTSIVFSTSKFWILISDKEDFSSIIYSDSTLVPVIPQISMPYFSYDYTIPSGVLYNNMKCYLRIYAGNQVGWGTPDERYFYTTPTPSPVLNFPPNNAINVELTPTLDWSDVQNATRYWLEVTNGSKILTTIISDSTLTISQYTFSPGILAQNTTYNWKVKSGNNYGWGNYSETYSFTTVPIPPETPNLSYPPNDTINMPLTFTFDWNDAPSATLYNIQISSDSIFWTKIINDSTITLSQYTIPFGNLENSTRYFWRVRAQNIGGWGNYSQVHHFTTYNTPGIPVLLSPANGAWTVPLTAFLDWSDIPYASFYNLQLGQDQSFTSNLINDSTILQSQYTVPSGILINGRLYYWRVRASNSYQWGNYSGVFDFVTVPPVPPAPNLMDPFNGSVVYSLTPELTWMGGLALFYRVQISTNNNFTSVVFDSSNVTVGAIIDIPPGVLYDSMTYYWRVNATNEGGTSPWSDIYSFTTHLLKTTLISPVNGSTDISITPVLHWSDEPFASSFKLQISTDSIFGTTILDTNIIYFDSVLISNGLLSANQKYYWRVLPVRGIYYGNWTAAWNFTTLQNLPSAPGLLSPVNGSTGQPVNLTFVWSKAPEIFFALSNKTQKNNEQKNISDNIKTLNKYWFEYSTDSTFTTNVIRDSSLTDTIKTVNGLNYLTKYFWRAKAKNQTGWGNFSSIWNLTTVPPIPSSPVLSSPINGSIDISLTPTLNWNSVTYALSYDVQLSVDSLFGTILFDSSGILNTNITMPSGKLTTLTKYYWRVGASNAGGTGPYSIIWNFTTIPNIPNAPVLFQPVNNSINQPTTITFKWNRSIETIDQQNSFKKVKEKTPGNQDILTLNKFWFEYSIDSTFTTIVARDSLLTDTVKTISGLSNYIKYYWRVKAKNQTGWGGFSAIWNFTTIVPIPNSPILISPATGSMDLSLTPGLDWSDVTYASNYRIQVSGDSLFGSTIFDSTGITVSNINIPSGKLLTLTKYYWRVNASNIAGTGVWSSVWNFTTIPNVPNAPVLVSPANSATGQPVNLTFVWRKAVENLLTKSKTPEKSNKQIPFNGDFITLNKYWLEYTSTDSTFTAGVIRDSSVADTTKSVTLDYNTKYWWRVKGKNQTGWGSFSAVWSFTTILPVPAAPVLLLPANNATGVSLTPMLDWTDVTYATSYRIQVSSDSIFAAILFDTTGVTVSQLTVPASKLTGLTKYYWRTNATNISGTGSWSTIWNFRTLQSLTLNLKVYLEGFWSGSIQKQDTVIVYLAGAFPPYSFVDSSKVYLSSAGTALITITNAPNANYYIVVQHRNHLQTWSALTQVFITNITVNYDFTTADTQAYGSNMKQVENAWVLFVGDANQDGSIDATDVTDFFIPQYGNTGYLSCDFNCDYSVDAVDVPYLIDNYGLTKVVPTLDAESPDIIKEKKIKKQDELNYLFNNKNNNLIKSNMK